MLFPNPTAVHRPIAAIRSELAECSVTETSAIGTMVSGFPARTGKQMDKKLVKPWIWPVEIAGSGRAQPIGSLHQP